MGVKSTYIVQRDVAIDLIKSKIDNCSNEEIADILEGFKESCC